MRFEAVNRAYEAYDFVCQGKAKDIIKCHKRLWHVLENIRDKKSNLINFGTCF